MNPACKAILDDPAASDWIKAALLSALERDPVDALNDTEALRAALREWNDSVLKQYEQLLKGGQDEMG